MNRSIVFILFVALCQVLGCRSSQTGPLLPAEMGYNKPGIFIYKVMHSTADGTRIGTDTLGLFCSNRRMEEVSFQNASTWVDLSLDREAKYTLAQRAGNSISGIEINDTMLFIHPPRYGPYRLLEFCPMPLYIAGKKNGIGIWISAKYGR